MFVHPVWIIFLGSLFLWVILEELSKKRRKLRFFNNALFGVLVAFMVAIALFSSYGR